MLQENKTDDQISYLCIKFFSGEATKAEKAELLQWVKENKNNSHEFVNARNAYISSGIRKPLAFDEQKAIENFKQKTHKKSFILNPRFIAAASILLVFGIGIILWTQQDIKPEITQEFTCENSNNNVKKLADNSSVYLHNNTKITYTEFSEKRCLDLQGEAFFDIAHNPNKPFTISTKNVKITVVGTSFFVDNLSDPNSVIISVFSGKVRVSYNNTDKLLLSNQECIINLHTQNFSVSDFKNENKFAWKTKKLVFDSTPLETVCTQLSNYFNVEFVIHSNEIKQLLLTTVFENPEITEVLDLLQLTYPVVIKQSANRIEILKAN